ncbi:MAG: patatin family protein, partial [Eubacteriales bacterium]|nr:patatin family protein [Eubacteriales bacterium]
MLFESGGMRESYSSGIANVLMQYGLFFDYVSGISAGSSTTVNYLSRDIIRTKHSFVDDVNDPDFGGIRTFMQGKGFFSAEYIYEIAGQSDGTIPFDFETFERNPAECVIGAFNADTGEMRYWDKSQLDSLEKMMRVVRASSTLPVIMPAINIEGHTYVDGGLQDSIPLAEAQRRGYEKFFVVATRPRDYRKSEPTPMNLYAARMLV